jgi:hypothetical protein
MISKTALNRYELKVFFIVTKYTHAIISIIIHNLWGINEGRNMILKGKMGLIGQTFISLVYLSD